MRTRTYVVLLIVLLLSIGLAMMVPESAPYFRALATVPGIAAVAGGLFLILRDELAHQRQIERDSSSNAFHVAAQSHMAKVLFDKHVLFAEAYALAAREIVGKLFKDGPRHSTRDIEALTRVRLAHGLWVSASLAAQLDTFEMQFIRIGNAMALWEDKAVRPRLPDDHLDKAFDLFYEITGITRTELAGQSPEEHTHSIQIMMTWLQRLLGVEQLTSARERAITGASSANPSTPSAHN